MIKLQSESINIATFDSILLTYKSDLLNNVPQSSLTGDFIHSYLQTLAIKLISNRAGLDKILNVLNISFTNDESESLINKVIINANTIGAVCDAHGILPSEIDKLVDNKVQQALNSYIYKIEDDETLSAENDICIKIFKGSSPKKIFETQENTWVLLVALKCKKAPFSKAIIIHDEFKKRFISGIVIDKEFITTYLCPFIIKENNEVLTYDEFIALFADNIILAYEFILYFVDISYSRNFKKKQ